MSDDAPLFQDSDRAEREYAGEPENESATDVPEAIPLILPRGNVGFNDPVIIPGIVDETEGEGGAADTDEGVRR